MRSEISGPGVYPDMPDVVYHSDPAPAADGGSLSRSGAVRLVPPNTAASFDHWRRNADQDTSDALDFGAAAHRHVLTEGAAIHVVGAQDWRTKDARIERDAARARGQIPILPKQRARIEEMAQAIRDHPIAARLLAPGRGTPEVSLFWRHAGTGRWCRARPDVLPRSGLGRRYVVPDYKTAADASADAFGKAAADHGYHQQDPWYCDGIRAVGIDPDPIMIFVVQEKRRPYLVNVVELDWNARELGRRHNAIAANLFDRYTTAGHWPGYGDEIDVATLPPWILKREGL